MNCAVFLDRDGVLIEDADLLVRAEEMRLLPGVAHALRELHDAGFKLIVVSNQTVVARGLATEEQVGRLNRHLGQLLEKAGAPAVDGWYFCPHHPKATLLKYRQVCECRKPAPGMLKQGAREHEIALERSFMVGDRISDILAGAAAGCRTVLVQTGKHTAAPIETVEPMDTPVVADYSCPSLAEASRWILHGRAD